MLMCKFKKKNNLSNIYVNHVINLRKPSYFGGCFLTVQGFVQSEKKKK